jgi:hypothetical protein
MFVLQIWPTASDLFCFLFPTKKYVVPEYNITEWLWLETKNNSNFFGILWGEHITGTYMTDTDTNELKNLSHNLIDIFIIET